MAYLNRFATHFDLHKYIRYGQKIDKVIWNEDLKVWVVTTETGEIFQGNFFLHGAGALQIPLKPAFKVCMINASSGSPLPVQRFVLQNSDSFKGPVFHTAEWNSSVELSNKKVAVIGTGATAIQLVPALANKVERLHLFQRTAAWAPIKQV